MRKREFARPLFAQFFIQIAHAGELPKLAVERGRENAPPFAETENAET
jgi:hypothetical protein